MSSVNDKLSARLARPTFSFTIPEGDRSWETDPAAFEMQQLTLLQEIDAGRAAAAQGSPMAYVYAQIERALVSIDGKPVDQGLPVLDNFSPAVRSLMSIALDHISSPKTDRTSFLKNVGMRIE